MLNLRLILRNLFKAKSYAIFNIIGLGIGFACTFMVIIWVKNELSYDKHLPDADRIYRLTFETTNAGITSHFARCWEPWVWEMSSAYPQIEELVRLAPFRHTAVKIEEEKFYSDRIFATDTNFFDVFNTDFITGNPEQALQEPYSVVISSSVADKYFGEKDPLGQSILLSGEYDTKMELYTVRGVMKDTPVNSHVHFDLLTSFARPEEAPSWAYVYLFLKKDSDPSDLLLQLSQFIEELRDESDQMEFIPHLQKITDIHLYSDKDREIEPNGNINGLYLFITIAIVLLLVSWVNYYNLNKARLFLLQKQLNIQNIIGSGKLPVIMQSVTASVISVILALILSWILLGLTGIKGIAMLDYIRLTPGTVRLSGIWLFVFSIALISVVIGSLPVINYVLKEKGTKLEFKLKGIKDNHLFSSYGLLMTLQFGLSIILIVAAIVINRQKEHMFSLGIGEMSSDIFVFKNQNWEIRSRYNAFRTKALQNPLIKDITASMAEPSGETLDALLVESPAFVDDQGERRLYVLSVEDNFLDFFNIPLIAGRNFSLYNPERKGEDYILNETAVKYLGWTPEEAIGKPFTINFNIPDIFYGGTVVGVVKDFNFNTAKQEIKPYVLFQKPIFYLDFLVRIDSTRRSEAIAGLRKIWDEELPDYPFYYEPLDDLYRSAYGKELSQAQFTSLFSLLAIIIICIGLISFTSVVVVQRTKEIGIRKVNGARLSDILILLNKNLIKRSIISFIMACPVVWFIMDKWLQHYVYKTEMSWWIFLLSGLIVLLISIVTVSLQSWKTAVRNPVEVLRYE